MFVRQLILGMLGMAFAYFLRRAVSQAGANPHGGAGAGQPSGAGGRSGPRSAKGGASSGAGKGPVPVDGKMVRDRICNTYLPEDKALTSRQDGTTHYFCSEPCRQSFLADRAAS